MLKKSDSPLVCVCGVLIALLVSSSAHAASVKILPAPQKISPHVYAWIGPYGGASKENHGYRMNLAFVVGKQAVAVIDTGYTEAMAKEMLDYIRAITPLPIKYAINTNSQPHRYLGNDVFRRAGAHLIAHRTESARMARLGNDQVQAVITTLQLPAGSVQAPAPPDQLLDGDLNLELGDLAIRILSVGAAHTPAQLVVQIPADNVVYAGDVLLSGRLLAILPDGNVKSWLNAYAALASFGEATFIPGHGQPGKLKTFDSPTRDYLKLLYDHMGKKIEAGADIQEAISTLDQSYFKNLADFDALAGRNASWAYLEREAEFFSK